MISISNLANGSALLNDEESFLTDLSDAELQISGGGGKRRGRGGRGGHSRGSYGSRKGHGRHSKSSRKSSRKSSGGYCH
jgi:hypothetical protein